MSDEEVVEDEGPKQTVRRLPQDEEVGPFFPSGMSAPEAALAGATADMDEETVAGIEAVRAEEPE